MDTIQPGSIIMWFGLPINIPSGWALCDGTKGTPNLKGKFIVGYDPNDTDYSNIGNTGGEKQHKLTQNEMPAHSHNLSSNGSHSHSYNDDYFDPETNTWKGGGSATGGFVGYNKTRALNTQENGSHSHTVNPTGGNTAHENRPPYYVLAYIMKLNCTEGQ